MGDSRRSDLTTEEDVKVKFLLPLLEAHGYKPNVCEFEKAIEIQEGRKRKKIFADVIVYTSASKKTPLILCETKAPTTVVDRLAREQAISYARLLPKIAPFALVTNGGTTQIFQTVTKNRVHELPRRGEIDKDIVGLVVSREVQEALRAEAKHELFIIDDVQSFKSILKACHNEIRNNEGYDPTVAFDEMTKVLFCKMYEEKRPTGNRFQVAVFDDGLERLHVNVIRQIFEETKGDPRYSGLFEKDTAISLKDRTIRKIVSLFENYDLSLTAFDVKGEAFEYFLGDTFTGGLGEFFTPRNIVEFMGDAVDPKIGDRIIDPFCGTGGFLIYAFEVVSEKIRLQEFSDSEKERWRLELSNRSLYGTDWKERTSQACKMNMMVHGDGSAGVFKAHGLVDIPGSIEEGQFDICLTNPPFGSIENDAEVLKHYELGRDRKSQDRVILAVERALRLVRPGGWVSTVVIDGVLNNDSTRYVREYIRRSAWVRGVISLAPETFEGYGARAKTSVLLLEKKAEPDEGQQQPVFMAVAQNTGYAPNGGAIPGNQLPDILMDYRLFRRGEEPRYHSDAWVTAVSDRLDAEFYWRPAASPSANLTGLKNQLDALMATTRANYEELARTISDAQSEIETTVVQLDQLFEERQEREILRADTSYRLLGVRWWGAGAFAREGKLGRDIKGKALFRVSAGWVVYNRLFAFRGSFALIGDEHHGCYASSEFPTFAVKAGVEAPDLVARYVINCLNSPAYLQHIDRLSTGSTKTSRNRFKQHQFLALRVRIPSSPDDVLRLVTLMERADALRRDQATLLDRTKDLWGGIASKLPGPE